MKRGRMNKRRKIRRLPPNKIRKVTSRINREILRYMTNKVKFQGTSRNNPAVNPTKTTPANEWSAIAKRPNAWNYIVTALDWTKHVMAATVWAATISISTTRKEIMLLWRWWIVTPILLGRKYKRISISRAVIARSPTVWRSTVSAIRPASDAAKIASAKNARMFLRNLMARKKAEEPAETQPRRKE